uniref:catechol O-methyltransferase A-like n=1 Tax=Ciona intestinalis TaxID=7719 RepID=UPI000180C921|nr:catechol O-methyltransferase A-like [Ciona intestinalis]|eukprot:XP_002124861.1 catechol O-methyltransferase A-like [Ciona intestinalis]
MSVISDAIFPPQIGDHVIKTGIRGDVTSVINVMDQFCYEYDSARLNIGDVKGAILDKCFLEASPQNVLELGCYCGYSALRMGRLLKEGAKIYTVEGNPDFADVAHKVITFAGMEEKIQIVRGFSGEVLPTIDAKYGVRTFDFVFIDHAKDLYDRDLKMLEDLGLMRNGTTILADNVIYPGAPKYLEYVRNNTKYKCTNYPTKLQFRENIDDALERSVYLL